MNKYYDTISVMQVIGCVYNNPSLLDFTDKYSINEEDFCDTFHRTVFGAIYNLYQLGAEKISLRNIADFFSSRPKHQGVYEANKGEEWLIKVSEGAIAQSFDYYYHRMKKMTLLRAYNNVGLDVSDIYDTDNILDAKKKQAQEEYLDNASLLDIAQRIDDKIEKVKMQYVDEVEGEAHNAAAGIDDLLTRLAQYPDAGVPLYGPLVNTVTRGARLKKLYLRSAPSGFGKAIPNDSIIPTPTGDRKVGDIKPGDYLFGQDGKPTKVLQIHPQKEKKEIWEVTFSDGRKAQCCGEHLWEYRYESHRGHAYRVEDIQTIYNRTLSLKNGLRNSEDRGYRFYIRLNRPVEYSKKEYSLPPYTMGAFLGDGSFRYNNKNKSLAFSSMDAQIPTLISIDLMKNNFGKNSQYYFERASEENYTWYFKCKDNPNHPIWVEEFLKEYPDLWNIKSENKFIPKAYLQGSVSQRRDLLRGLMDTDGSIDKKGRTSYTTISPQLRDDIIELCRSLGYIVTYTVDSRPEKYVTGECYHVHIQCPKAEKPLLFSLSHKLDRAIKYNETVLREEAKDHIAIVDIQKTEQLADMTCFTVDNDNHLFLMNDYIVTHNTRTMIADVCNIGCNMIYDDTFGWIKNGIARPTLYITTEQEIEEVQTMMLSFLSAVNEEHILGHRYEGDEEERVRKAVEILKESKIFIVELPDFSLSDVENVIKLNIRDNDIKYVFNPKRV